MIWAELRDGGTAARISRGTAPGMDSLTWHPLREYEEASPGEHDRVDVQNAGMVATDPETVAPWPLDVPHQAPVDVTPRYDGLTFVLHELNAPSTTEPYGPLPGGAAAFTSTPLPTIRQQAAIGRLATMAELQALPTGGTDYIRQPYGNESGNCALVEPALLRWTGGKNQRFAVELEDNDLFTPFDLSDPDRYLWVDDDLKPVEHGEQFARVGDRSYLILYLRPRRWRWFVRVIAHYLYISWFEEVPNDEIFLEVYFDRPPFYPFRHDVLHTADDLTWWHEWEGEMLAFDAGVEYAWNHSLAADDMRDQILDQQWYSLCIVYVLIGVEPAAITLARMPPRMGDIVAGVGRRDKLSGVETRIWAVQKNDDDGTYPQQPIGKFWSDFDVYT